MIDHWLFTSLVAFAQKKSCIFTHKNSVIASNLAHNLSAYLDEFPVLLRNLFSRVVHLPPSREAAV